MRMFYSDELILILEHPLEVASAVEIAKIYDIENAVAIGFDTKIAIEGIRNGFLPMAVIVDDEWSLFLRHHRKRCVMEFENLKIDKRAERIAKNYYLTHNNDFDITCMEINNKFKESWLVDGIIEMYKQIKELDINDVRIHSFELYDEENCLVAGEIGYSYKSIYTSLTGFHKVSNTGKLQMTAMAKLLEQNGYNFWDLGMDLKYKLEMGAHLIDRDEFVVEIKNRKKDVSKIEDNNIRCDLILSGLTSQ